MANTVSILVASSAPELRKSLEDICLKAGCRVITSEDGIDALSALSSVKVDAFFAHESLDKLSGSELLPLIADARKYKHLKLFLVGEETPDIKAHVESGKISVMSEHATPQEITKMLKKAFPSLFGNRAVSDEVIHQMILSLDTAKVIDSTLKPMEFDERFWILREITFPNGQRYFVLAPRGLDSTELLRMSGVALRKHVKVYEGSHVTEVFPGNES